MNYKISKKREYEEENVKRFFMTSLIKSDENEREGKRKFDEPMKVSHFI